MIEMTSIFREEQACLKCDNSEDGIYIAVKDFLGGKIKRDSLAGLEKNSAMKNQQDRWSNS